jgi:hypothetical protein
MAPPPLTQDQIEQRFNEVTPLPNAISTQRNKMFKPAHGVIEEYYKTNESFPNIRAYYDNELSRRGWHFEKENNLTSWWRQRGEKIVFYCQGSTSAELYYSGQEGERLGYTYSFGLSWGLYDCD